MTNTKRRPRDASHRFVLPEAEICKRYLAGEPATAIAASCGVCAPVIYDRLRRAGTTIRQASAAQRAPRQLGLPTEDGPITIYALVDPRDRQTRYVGKSTDPRSRLNAHLRAARIGSPLHSARWIAGLLRQGLRPVLTTLEIVAPSEWQEAESRWIEHFRAIGCAFTNETPGGWSGMAGEANPNAHLADNQVCELAERFIGGESPRRLAAEYRIGRTTLYRLLRGDVRASAIPERLRNQALAIIADHRMGPDGAIPETTREDVDAVLDLWNAGTAQREISRRLGIPHKRVHKILNREMPARPRRRLRRLTESDVVEVFRLRAGGAPYQRIADQIGCSEAHVRKVIRGEQRITVPVPESLRRACAGMDRRRHSP